MTTDPDFLEQVLLQQVRQAQRAQPKETSFECAVAAALATTVDERAWALVSLAARLRSEGNVDLALRVLDAAVAFGPEWRAQSAAFTTAAAIHCDLGQLDTARAICDETLARGVDPYLLKIALRVYWELFRSTKLEEFRVRWESLSHALEAVEGESAAATP
jgi:tetratricopeptide (TPR) repeat protein